LLASLRARAPHETDFLVNRFCGRLAFAYVVKQTDSSYAQPMPASLPFMLLMLMTATVIYQIRFNLENAPPPPSISGELIAFYAGSSALIQLNG